MRFEWDRPLTLDHLVAIGMVRKALEKGCRTIDEIVDYTGLWHIDAACALRYLLGDRAEKIIVKARERKS